MPFPRSSGLLLHPTSFPGRFGIGDLGGSAYRFVEFLEQSRQQLWQILPLGPTGFGNSPYAGYSAMAGNPLLISLEILQGQGLLDGVDLNDLPDFPADHVDFDRVIAYKMPLLLKAADHFRTHASIEQRTQYETFCASRAFWLNDYAFFMALKEAHEGASWYDWEPEIAHRKPEAMAEWHDRLNDQIFNHKFLQFEFFREWENLRRYANDRGISIIGDVPIYVAHDSADVWAQPHNFKLNAEGQPTSMAGVPPDFFSDTGQLWGNPIYDWDAIAANKYEWWIERFRSLLDYVDLIRIDHFRGFCAYWAVPQGETTALGGEWIEAPGKEFFTLLKQELGSLPILAEDLGVITPDVEELRDRFEFPGMRILHFAFGNDPTNPFLPFNYIQNCVVYTGTHDNDTTVGWYEQLPEEERRSLHDYLGCTGSDGIHWDLIRLAFSSVGNQAIVPLQDVLGLGTEARMNFPGKAEGNWSWRYHTDALKPELGDRLAHLTQIYGRVAKPRSHD
ncbi:4-alpha-glucanotransferase [Microcoleus sp. FACHB-1515]|uniref:4-alpha-glucanotransferase n=1 Tax=Cyanophyceae TaxID=3028117 RepID=UPI0016836E85|nr:4-alpha-glucanotransferase [Microcoleus sp. FACHB-1515]MBD2091372.1 4-alpha-glucanotransferase [Microcoleus sp. FACHB-1515]